MRILFITQYFFPETNGAANRLTGLARELVKLGNQVGVITGMPNYPTGRVFAEYQNHSCMTEEVFGIKIFRVWLYTSPQLNLLRRFLNYFSFVISSLRYVIQLAGSYDVVIVSSPPLVLGLTGLIYRWWWKVPLVFDVRDIWPEVVAELGEIRRSSGLFRAAQALEQYIYKKASLVTVVTEGKKKALQARGVPANKLACIPNGFDREIRYYPTQPGLKKKLGLEDKFVVLYPGLIGKAQGLNLLLDLADRIKNQRLHFLLVGDGVERQNLLREISSRKLTNISLLPTQPHEQIVSLFRMADLVWVSLKNGAMTSSIPSKLYEALALACPVLLVAGGESAELLRESGSGLSIAPEDTTAIQSTLEDILAGNLQLPRATAGNNIIHKYARDQIARTLAAHLASFSRS
ncbi:MAG TPA: glycosyltransferase family 4 protein [Bacillota bacterium]|nr:glycosyltransferase family 4 protein [Bacillota bacterium]